MDGSLGSSANTTTNNNYNPPPTGTSSGFNHYYGNGRGGPCCDQHGGQQSAGTGVTAAARSVHSTMDQVQNSHEGYNNNNNNNNNNSPYNHYPNYRPGYGSGGSGGMMSPSRQGNNLTGPGSSGSKAAMTAPSTPAGGGGFPRFPGQQSQQQMLGPSGATPTLNQLLTSPSTVMRAYGSGYPDYNNPPSMALKDMSSGFGSAALGWGGQQRNHPRMSPGSTGQNAGQGAGRSQVASMDPMAMKRSQLYGMSNNPYSQQQQQQQQQGAPYSGQPYRAPSPHRYPMGVSSRGQMAMGGMQYSQQQVGGAVCPLIQINHEE
ncbi:AT-rich interactive domain-containing protein 1B-like [Labrus mixtus]|uniref:AT-rich interactive domain-containing protein 1B-like n=1 Tax=Labrus mixtus TaxID=508554 RepID=UPI0029C040ED|nr:AT-rich interactive domain-containing protein 1B-like [Labrus mixtus]